MKTLVQQIQEIMEGAEQHVRVVQVRAVSPAEGDQWQAGQKREATAPISEELRAN